MTLSERVSLEIVSEDGGDIDSDATRGMKSELVLVDSEELSEEFSFFGN